MAPGDDAAIRRTVAALQVTTKEDTQVAKAIEDMPRARELALAAMRLRSAP